MILLWLLPGLALPTITGWLVLGILEGRTPVLRPAERWVLGFVLGLTLVMFLAFLGNVLLGIPFSFFGFLGVEAAATAIAGAPFLLRPQRAPPRGDSLLRSFRTLPRRGRVVVLALGLWMAVKIAAMGFILATTPPYFDDTLSNWNIRGKLFYHTQEMTLMLPSQKPGEEPSGISSYPPTVPLVKTSLAAFAGGWEEPLVNGVHLLWYLASLGIVFLTLRRLTSFIWALLGAYLLGSLPLYLVQGSNAYADVFLSAHVITAASLLLLAVSARGRAERLAFFRLAAFATALLAFTKNEGLILYLPVLGLIAAASLFHLTRRHELTGRDAATALAWFAVLALLIAGPWTGFKWAHGLAFGNAHDITGFDVAWQPGVLQAVFINTFFEANWLLLFPLLILLLAWKRREAFGAPLLVLTAFFLILYGGQMILYLSTGLSHEALMQTGYARGLVHLVPVVCVIVTVLLQKLLDPAGTADS